VVVVMVGVGERNVNVGQILLSLDRVGRVLQLLAVAAKAKMASLNPKRGRDGWAGPPGASR